jgi:hypothetical protein
MTLQQVFEKAGSKFPFVATLFGEVATITHRDDRFWLGGPRPYSGVSDEWHLLEKETAEARGETSQADCACDTCYGTVPVSKEAPVSETKRPFKAGDRVCCKNDSASMRILTKGEVYTVSGFDSFGALLLDGMPGSDPNDDDMKSGWSLERFELVEPAKDTSELEELVRKANSGLAAARSLCSLEGVELKISQADPFRDTDHFFGSGDFFAGVEFRIKPPAPPAPTFEPLTLPDSGYAVSVLGDIVKVGCFTIGLAEGLQLLEDLTSNSGGHCLKRSIFTSRNGVRTPNGDVTWRDADILLEKLEAYQKALEEHEKRVKEVA